jgi:hypothetical protein
VALHKKDAPIKKVLDNFQEINLLEQNAFIVEIINSNELDPFIKDISIIS